MGGEPVSVQCETKKKEEANIASSSRSFGKVLNRLAERGAGDARGTCDISADHATLVSKEPTLSGDALSQRLGRNRVRRNDSTGSGT
jgi:hypothetical protein